MAKFRGERAAFGWPGIEPRWTYADKDGVGTAYAISSRIWFTLLNGVLTEIYCPTVDRPQVRDLQYLITDGSTFFHEERRHLRTSTERIAPQARLFERATRCVYRPTESRTCCGPAKGRLA